MPGLIPGTPDGLLRLSNKVLMAGLGGAQRAPAEQVKAASTASESQGYHRGGGGGGEVLGRERKGLTGGVRLRRSQ